MKLNAPIVIKLNRQNFNMKNIICLILFLLGSQLNYLPAQNAGDNFFDSDTIHEIRLTFNQANYWDSLIYYKNLTDSIGENIYMEAGLEINGTALNPIGARIKGNSSYWAYPGNKKAFKLDLNEYFSEQKYDGFKKLSLNNSFNDPSFLREKLLLDYIRKHNIPGPRCTFANVYINNNYWGFYTVVEQIDKTFLDDYFGNKDGNLFKGDPHGKLKWKGPDQTQYYNDYELKTNESTNDWSDLVELIDKINNSSPAEFEDSLNSIFNTSIYLKSWAANILFVSLDSYIGFGHNYYIYHNSATHKFEWITWDANGCFGVFNLGMNVHQLKNLSVLFVKNPPMELPLNPKILSNIDLKNEYLNYIAGFLASDFDTSYFFPIIDSLAGRIRSDVYADTMKMFSNQEFEDNIEYTIVMSGNKSISALKDFFTDRVPAVISELAGLGIYVGHDELVNLDFGIDVYPNPATDFFTIEFNKTKNCEYALKLYDLSGKLVKEIDNITTERLTINTGNLNNGIYLLRLINYNDKITYTRKLLIE
ncbi:MAG: CotH kinase family protein [Bacteroidota bacterium]|nr:CotH kinase family protein [Bacteroidota bacterium]